MKHSYDPCYRPAFPTVPVVLHNSEKGWRTVAENARLLDGPANLTDVLSR
jgi:hypothetical protein